MWYLSPRCSLLLGSTFASQTSGSKEKGSSVGPVGCLLHTPGPSCIHLGLHRFHKFLDLFFQGFVPPLNILPGALHIAEADFQGCRLLLLLLQLFVEPHHLSPDIIVLLLKATRKERKEWKNWALSLDSAFTLTHNLFYFPFHIIRPLANLYHLFVSQPDRSTP